MLWRYVNVARYGMVYRYRGGGEVWYVMEVLRRWQDMVCYGSIEEVARYGMVWRYRGGDELGYGITVFRCLNHLEIRTIIFLDESV